MHSSTRQLLAQHDKPAATTVSGRAQWAATVALHSEAALRQLLIQLNTDIRRLQQEILPRRPPGKAGRQQQTMKNDLGAARRQRRFCLEELSRRGVQQPEEPIALPLSAPTATQGPALPSTDFDRLVSARAVNRTAGRVLSHGIHDHVFGGHMMLEEPLIRWHAAVTYRTDSSGPVDVHHELEELEELHHLVERGPHWDTIEKIEIVRVNHNTAPDLTVERAKEI
jgi:hypothetical protein